MKKRRKRILLLVETSLSHGRHIIRGISQFAREQGNWDIFFQDRGLHEAPSGFGLAWDGIISRSPTRCVYEEQINSGIPFVELLYGDANDQATEVLEDIPAACAIVANHLIFRGLDHFAFFAPMNTWWVKLITRYFSQALQDRGKSPPNIFPGILGDGDSHPSMLQIYDSKQKSELLKWLRSLPKPVGILVPLDMYAVPLYEAAHRLGIAIPEEVAIIGMDNDRFFCQTLSPSLSSVDINSKLIGYSAAMLLDKKMHRQSLPQLPVLISPAGIVVRQSTEVIATQDVEVRHAIRLIRENINAGICVSDILKAIDISRSSLERRFRATLGHSPDAEIVRYRMERVQEMLRETDEPIKSIAQMFGYAEEEYFTRAFKRFFGITPHQFRLNSRGDRM